MIVRQHILLMYIYAYVFSRFSQSNLGIQRTLLFHNHPAMIMRHQYIFPTIVSLTKGIVR